MQIINKEIANMDLARRTVEIQSYPWGIRPTEELFGKRLDQLEVKSRSQTGATEKVELYDPALNTLYIFSYLILNRSK